MFDPSVKYFRNSDKRAPVSFVGSGEVQVKKALDADFYAFCVEDATPVLSLGLIDAASDVVIRKRVRVVNLSSSAQELAPSFLFREQEDEDSGAIAISFFPSVLFLNADCGSEVLVEVEFRITASLAPPNIMTSGGSVADDFRLLDRQEFDGWISLSTIEKDINLPFHVLLRQAAEVTVTNPVLPAIDELPIHFTDGLTNKGAGVAQIDAFELIFMSSDDPETGRGSNNPDLDFRYIGYRVLPVFETNCEYLLEFAITTWERTQRLQYNTFQISIDIDGDFLPDFGFFNTGPGLDSGIAECRLFGPSGVETCTGFAVDHSTNTANTVLRVCSNDLGISEPQVINVRAITFTVPTSNTLSDITEFTPILFLEPALAVSSYDIAPGGALNSILVTDSSRIQSRSPLGILLMTNSYRDPSRTGAATRETEALAILRSGRKAHVEATPDLQELPIAFNLGGPVDCTWEQDVPSACKSTPASSPEFETLVDSTIKNLSRDPGRRLKSCPEKPIPRVIVTMPSHSPTRARPLFAEKRPVPSGSVSKLKYILDAGASGRNRGVRNRKLKGKRSAV